MDDPKIPLWLDCDPAQDAFAILLAAHHPRLSVLGISTVHGNAPLSRTTHNALSVLTAIGTPHIPVYPGAAKPFCRAAEFAPDIHGTTGLDGTTHLPTPLAPPRTDKPAILAMRDALLSTPKETAWLVATGALTNIALLFAVFPEVGPWIKGLSIMGGAIGSGFTEAPLGKVNGIERVGNWTRWAEFNIYCDPESTLSLLSHPILSRKITLIPLDLTHLVLATPAVLSRLLLPSPSPTNLTLTLRPLLHDLLTYFAQTYHTFFSLPSPPLHDPLAVAVILPASEGLGFDDRGGERWEVDVVTGVGEEKGRIGVRKVEGGEGGGVRIPRGVDVDGFWGVVEECVGRAEEVLLGGWEG